MATIYKRKDVTGIETWRVQIRRKGYKTFCLSFDGEKDAREWANIHEPKFLRDGPSYLEHIEKISLLNNREREIKRNE